MGNFGLLALYVAGFIAIFYFLAIRPQQRQRKAHDALVARIKRGDRIVTVGGIHGKVKRTEDTAIVLEIAKGVDVRLSRRAIAEVVEESAPAEEPKVSDTPPEIEGPAADEPEATGDVEER